MYTTHSTENICCHARTNHPVKLLQSNTRWCLRSNVRLRGCLSNGQSLSILYHGSLPHKMVRLERMSDYRGVGLERMSD